MCKATCDPPYYANPLNKNCELNCPIGYYKSNSDQTCFKCNDACVTCTDGTLTTCAGCYDPYFLDTSDSKSLCTKTCPIRYYPDD